MSPFIFNYGRSGYDGARYLGDKDWLGLDLDQQDIWTTDAFTLGGRSADLVRNNSFATSLISAMASGVIGSVGITFRSLYEVPYTGNDIEDDASKKNRTNLEKQYRLAIQKTVDTGLESIDASGDTYKQLLLICLSSKIIYGEVFLQRVFLDRPGYGTAWRVIHPFRVYNPKNILNDDTLSNGIKLDSNGTPIGIYVHKNHPSKVNNAKIFDPIYIPIFDKFGMRQVIWYASKQFPEQIRGFGWYAPILTLIRHLGKVQEAHIIGKRSQACIGTIHKNNNRVSAAAADRTKNDATNDVTISPNTNIYCKPGEDIIPFSFNYSGQDFSEFANHLLQSICAAFGPGIPYQFVLRDLPKSNMASSRAALMQAWRSFTSEAQDMIDDVCKPLVKSLIYEDISRSRLILPTGRDVNIAAYGSYNPPERLVVDDLREMQATESRLKIGVSPTTVFREKGYEFEDETRQKAIDKALEKELIPVEEDVSSVSVAEDDGSVEEDSTEGEDK